jgi:hypothetical protein
MISIEIKIQSPYHGLQDPECVAAASFSDLISHHSYSYLSSLLQ